MTLPKKHNIQVATVNSEAGDRVASWPASIGGLRWLNALAEAGKAACLPAKYPPPNAWGFERKMFFRASRSKYPPHDRKLRFAF